MEKWIGKVAVITGANSGIGLATLAKLSENKIITVGLDISTDHIENFKKTRSDLKIHTIKCDITNDSQISQVFNWIEDHLGGVDILINNAGIFRNVGVLQLDEPLQEHLNVIDVNFIAMVRCTRLAFKSMEARDTFGYIININSVAGHVIPQVMDLFKLGVYSGTKFAITATTETIRRELAITNNKKIRITSLSPGVVKTQIMRNSKVSEDVVELFNKNPMLDPEDIAENIAHLLSTPPHVNISEITIRPTGENL